MGRGEKRKRENVRLERGTCSPFSPLRRIWKWNIGNFFEKGIVSNSEMETLYRKILGSCEWKNAEKEKKNRRKIEQKINHGRFLHDIRA